MKVEVINKSGFELPQYATEGSAGMDLRSNNEETVIIAPGERALIKTGLYVQLPHGYELQIRPRSGLALKKGITVLNTPGTIDEDYRGEIGVILINHGNEPFEVKFGDKIAQAVLAKYEKVDFVEVNELSTTERGDGSYGHSDKK